MTEVIKKELAASQADMTAIVRTTNTRVALTDRSLAQSHLIDAKGRSKRDDLNEYCRVRKREVSIACLTCDNTFAIWCYTQRSR